MVKVGNRGPTIYYKGDKEIYGLQILKFICALLVVQIHANSGIKEAVLPLAYIGVPVFLMITGYFLPKPDGKLSKHKMKKMFKKICLLELFGCAVYLAYFVLACGVGHRGKLVVLTQKQYWIDLILKGTQPCYHLWYLVALLQCVTLMYVCVRLKIEKWLFWLIPLGLALNLMFGKYSFLLANEMIGHDITLSRNALTIGMPCLLIGVLIRYFEYKLPSQKKIILIAFVGLLGVYVESIILNSIFGSQNGNLYIFTIPLATAVFVYFLRLDVTGKLGHRFARYGKEYSLDIYLWHIVVGSAALRILTLLKLHPQTGDFDIVFVLIATLVVARLLKNRSIRHIYLR